MLWEDFQADGKMISSGNSDLQEKRNSTRNNTYVEKYKRLLLSFFLIWLALLICVGSASAGSTILD